MPVIRPVRIGIIGCGDIARRSYVPNCRLFPQLELVACADRDAERAAAFAAANAIPGSGTPDWLLARDDIELVVNLTNPQAHMAVNLACLQAGKHVYCEKPFALSREDGLAVLAAAAKRGLQVGSAPDTVLCSGVQTSRRLLDQGLIGDVVGGSCHMLSGGPEDWHPNPAFLYHSGAGPLLDMGTYYLHALISLIGPLHRVTASHARTWATRTITSKPLYGTVITVEVPTHVCAILEFVSGAIVTLTLSFDVKGGHCLPHIELHGAAGSIQVPDPNCADGQILLSRCGLHGWTGYDSTHAYRSEARGVGVAELAQAIRSGRPARVGGAIAMHALDAMLAIHESGVSRAAIDLTTTCDRPEAMPSTGLTGLPAELVEVPARASRLRRVRSVA